MSGTGETKKRILELLNEKSETLTTISKKLDLAPSTVSQHLKEMEDSGSIKPIDNSLRKWKYYEINRGNEIANQNQRWYSNKLSPSELVGQKQRSYGISARKLALPIAAVAIVLILALAFYKPGSEMGIGTSSAQQVYIAPGSSIPIGTTVFTISDSPTSYNITALYVTVVNASIHSESTGKWYSIPLQAKRFDLIKLKNISSIISGVNLSAGAYDNIVLNVSNVTAIANGSTKDVFLPSKRLVIVGGFNISNGTTNWINIDFNLQDSLHITGNGKLVMLPVINVRHVDDSSLKLNSSSIIVASGPGRVKRIMEFGMKENGDMVYNFSVPQNRSIEYVDGQVVLNGSGPVPIIIRTASGFIFGGDASRLVNITGGFVNASNPATVNARINEALPRECYGFGASHNVTSNSILPDYYVIVRSHGEMPVPQRIRCCYPVYVNFEHGTAIVSRCVFGGDVNVSANGTINTSNGDYKTCCPLANGIEIPCRIAASKAACPEGTYSNISSNSSGSVEVSASDLNRGTYAYGIWDSQNGTTINLSINRNGSSINAHCVLQDGAVSCTSAGDTGQIFPEISSDIGSNLIVTTGGSINAGSGTVVSTVIENSIINSTVAGNIIVSENTNTASEGNASGTGKLVIRGGTCINLTGGLC